MYVQCMMHVCIHKYIHTDVYNLRMDSLSQTSGDIMEKVHDSENSKFPPTHVLEFPFSP